MYLSRFRVQPPTYRVPQSEGLNWLAHAHSRQPARSSSDPGLSQLSETPSAQTFEKLLNRYGCNPNQIESRATFLRDFTHLNWNEMQIFSVAGQPASLESRMAFFQEVLQRPLDDLYPEARPEFQNWIHVTCTGYLAPSLIQETISRRGWGDDVQCLHAYHMGCYAALPALRMARGNLDCDILHTELCTLHLDPTRHEPEQLVVQSLFADGVIRYRVTDRPTDGFRIHDVREWVIGNSRHGMRWNLSSTGFQMTLAREVPKFIQDSIVERIRPWQTPGCWYAIHPGGPRIVDAVKEALQLSEEQVHFSRKILREHGNMSSATLPHIWNAMLESAPSGVPIISLAFGPGLTIAASLMERHRVL